MNRLLTGKVAVITGSAQGIGLSIARMFAEQGARVVISDIDPVQVRRVAAELGPASRVQGWGCNVTDAEDMRRLIDNSIDVFGAVDVMVNNAGITRDATMRKMTVQQFDEVIEVHLKGAWLGTKVAAVHMRERRSGSIVNLSSISGKVGLIGQTNYSAAKAGVVGLSKAAAKELAYRGVRVNCIQPGMIRTPMAEAMPQRIWDQKMAEIPLGRAGEPSEVAGAATFLASDLSSYMTGAVLEVTGGRHM